LSPRLTFSTTGKVACGLSLGPALIPAENPVFEMAYRQKPFFANTVASIPEETDAVVLPT
jgi:hypothetical protein